MRFPLALLAAVLLPAQVFAAAAAGGAGAGGAQTGDKTKELPKPEIEKKQDTLKNSKRFDAFREAIGKKADDLKKKIDDSKTEGEFEAVGREFESKKTKEFMNNEPSAPKAAGATDASRDAFYKDGTAKVGRAPESLPKSFERDALALKSGSFDNMPGGRRALNGSATPLSDQVLGRSQPIRDLKSDAALRGGPLERQAASTAQPAVGKDSSRADVAKTQGELNAYRSKVGLRQLAQDGLYGPKTTQATKDIQEKFGLAQTGRYDAQTRETLARRLSPSATAMDALKPGSHGPEVRELQKDLSARGLNVSRDGIYGAKTRSALAEFQKSRGLEPTGFMDAKTRSALDAAPKGFIGKSVDQVGKKAGDLFGLGTGGKNDLVKETAISKGLPYDGSLVNGEKLPLSGEGYKSVGNLNSKYGTDRLVNGIKLMGTAAKNQGRPDLLVDNLSDSDGGQLGRHASHQNGKDVDIKVQGGVNNFSAKQNWQLVESAINNPQFKVQYIFTSVENKAAVLAVARQELGGTNSSTYIRAEKALNIAPTPTTISTSGSIERELKKPWDFTA
jgi:peptidoglycan hydrolase-like protein with peptidoglycan-binding domain